MPEQCRTQAMA